MYVLTSVPHMLPRGWGPQLLHIATVHVSRVLTKRLQVRDDEADEVASFAGIGIGLTTLLRATPFRLVHDEIPLPADLLRPQFPCRKLFGDDDEGNDGNTLDELEKGEWNAAVEQMATTADAHLQHARQIQSKVPRAARSVLLPIVPSLYFLERLQAAQRNLMDPQLHEPRNLQLMLRLGRSWLTGSV